MMTIVLIYFVLPVMASILFILCAGAWDWLKRKGYPLSALRGELCPINSKEIDLYIKQVEEEDRQKVYLTPEGRCERADVFLGYVVLIKGNAWCFNMGATFDRYKIKSNKLSFQFTEEEALVWALERESGRLLWKVRRCEIMLRYKRLLRLRVVPEILYAIKKEYKTFEEQMVHFADMFNQGEDMRLALGLDEGWGVVRGGTAHLGRHDQEYDVDVDDDSGPDAV
jgi:hypothetical protein